MQSQYLCSLCAKERRAFQVGAALDAYSPPLSHAQAQSHVHYFPMERIKTIVLFHEAW